jgi:hypothetical protein
VRDSGEAVEDGFRAAGDAVSGLPVVGGEAGDALRDAGAGTGGEAAEVGQEGEDRATASRICSGWSRSPYRPRWCS